VPDNSTEEERSEEELPEDPYQIITVKWSPTSIPIVDCRGINIYEAAKILEVAANSLNEQIGDFIVFLDDEDVMDDSDIEAAWSEDDEE
jgi:hypothetical protein